VVGWVSAADELHLNPKDSEVVTPGSQLVFVAGVADAAVHMLETPYTVSCCYVCMSATKKHATLCPAACLLCHVQTMSCAL
jgi:hypothetical protein